MNFQKKYASYYDLIYQNKDYVGEVDSVVSALNKYNPNLLSILELGCGTGKHAFILSERGYQIDGIDLSDEMILIANKQLQKLPQSISENVKFKQGNLQTIRMEKQYDAIISLFHVMSYQTSNEDFNAAIATAKAHLKPNGIFLFDCWYGPGVLSNPPSTRVKRIKDEHMSFVRIAEPVIFPHDNLVEVNYEFFVNNKQTSRTESFRETHRMRYLFQPEVKMFLEAHQLKLLECSKDLNADELCLDSWSIYFIAQSK